MPINAKWTDRIARHRRQITVGVLGGVMAMSIAKMTQKPSRDVHRPIEARMTGADYAPFDVTALRGYSETIATEVATENLFDAERTPETLQQLGHNFLRLGRAEAAIEYLAEATAAAPTNASVLSDLAAAYLASGSFAHAAEAAASALHHDPTSSSAAFNWALALEGVSNLPAALRAWKQYLQLDGSSLWADEARRHLARLEQPRRSWDNDRKLLRPGQVLGTIRDIAERYPQRVRHWTQDEFLPRLLENPTSGDIHLASVIAETRARHDPFLRDVLVHARSAPAHSGLVDAINAFRRGRAAAEIRDVQSAAEHFARAAQLLQRAGSPLAFEAHVFAATHESYCGRGEEALRRLAEVQESFGTRKARYPAVMAELEWIRGLVLSTFGRNDDALEAYRSALEFARRSGEVEQEVAIAALIAVSMDTVGDQAEAERYRAEVLRRHQEIGGSRQRAYTIYGRAALSAIAWKRPRLALAFTDTQHELARQEKTPMLLAEVATTRAMACLELHELDRATNLIEEARQNAAAVTPHAMHDRTVASIEFIRGKIELQRDARRARDAFTAALSIWERHGWRRHTAMGRLFRARSHSILGDRRLAESDLRAGIDEMERERGNLREPQLRVGYFERAEELFNDLIELLLDEGRDQDALAIAERKRGRALLDVLAYESRDKRGNALPLRPSEIAAALPNNVAVLQFASLKQRTQIWLIRRGTIVGVRNGMDRRQLDASIERHLQAIVTNDDAGIRLEGRWLYDQLIAPIERHLPEGATLAVVADSSIHAVPFAALIAPDGRYFVERAAVVTSPSATLFVRGQTVTGTDGGLVAIAQPSPGGVPALRYALREVEEVARLYPNGAGRTGSDVTATEFLHAAETAAVIHFAGHATIDLTRPHRSALLFESADGSQAARLTAARIATSVLKGSPLVILAACKTGAGKVRHMEGVDSLAASFLAAGAGTVAATLWDVDDDPTSRLLVAFHRALRSGDPVPEALRNAQTSFIRSGSAADRQPRSWAGIFLAGSLQR